MWGLAQDARVRVLLPIVPVLAEVQDGAVGAVASTEEIDLVLVRLAQEMVAGVLQQRGDVCLGGSMPRDPVGIFIEDGRVLVVGGDFAAVAGAEGDLGERAVGDRVPKETGGVSDQDAVVETGLQGRIAEGLHGAGADGVIGGFAEGEDTQRGSVGFRRDKEDTLCIVDVARAEVLDVGLGVGGVEGEGVRGDAKRI